MLNLDGIWKFAWTADPQEKPVFDSFASVPGCFDAVGLRFNQRGIGHYRRTITCSGKKQRLKIASFGLHARVFLDETMIAESWFAWSPLTVDFTAEKGEHLLTICVDNFNHDHPLFFRRYDFYAFGGIYDHVTLSEVPENEIRSLKILPLDHKTGEVELQIETEAPVLHISFDGKKAQTYDNTSVLRLKVPDFQLWSPESPHLHTVTVNERTEEFGIRTLDWKGEVLLLNGQPVKLVGVNRHESHPEFGAATPEALIASDLLRIRQAGCNFIRGSHYPQREFFFKMCDRLGIMVWEEPLSWGNSEDELKIPRFLDSLAEQLVLTIRNSFNHPSLVIHGFLNECASDTETAIPVVRRMMEICHREDPTRPATFASNRRERDLCFELTDIIALNVYPAWYGDLNLSDIPGELDRLAAKFHGKPKVLSEIGASAIYGDHSEEPYTPWSEEYQAEYVRSVISSVLRNDAWSGVMLWLYCNANTYTETIYKTNRPRAFNNKGLLDEYRRPKAAWMTLRKILAEGDFKIMN